MSDERPVTRPVTPSRVPLTRRVVLKILGASSISVATLSVATLSLAGCGSSDSEDDATGPGKLFTGAERRALGALANIVVPSEPGSPGAAELGAASYIERLLTAFDVDPPAIFADGPFSGRLPLPDGKGGTAGVFPPSDFVRFMPLDRVTEKSWRIRLYGSLAVPGGTINEGLVAPVVGLRDLFKDGLKKAVAEASAPIETLSPADLRDVFGGLDTDLQKAFVDLVPQAVWGAPEYGGNPDGQGWKLVHFEGDSQPFGYSIFDESTNTYHERLDAPMTTKDPGPDPAPMDEGTHTVLAQVVAFTDGKVFP